MNSPKIIAPAPVLPAREQPPSPARQLLRTYLTPKRDIPRRVEYWLGLVVGTLILALWCALSYGGLVDAEFLPTPQQVWDGFSHTVADGTLATHILVSLKVIYLGFALASVVAVPLGILMGSFRAVAALFEPVINFVRYLPVTSMIPLLILWIGIGIEEKVAIIFIGTFFQQVVMIADVSSQVQRDLFNAAYTLGATRRQVITRVLLPATLPGVMDTLRVTMGWAWTYLVVAEMVAADSGLGYMSLQAMRGMQTDLIFVGIVVIGALGLVTDLIFKFIRNLALPWATQH